MLLFTPISNFRSWFHCATWNGLCWWWSTSWNLPAFVFQHFSFYPSQEMSSSESDTSFAETSGNSNAVINAKRERFCTSHISVAHCPGPWLKVVNGSSNGLMDESGDGSALDPDRDVMDRVPIRIINGSNFFLCKHRWKELQKADCSSAISFYCTRVLQYFWRVCLLL